MSRLIITELSPGEKYRFLPWLICGIGAAFYFYEYLLRIAPSVLLPDLMQTYHLSGAQLGNLSASFYYAYTPMQLIIGILMDKYGPRYLLLVACAACSIGAFMFAGSQHIYLAELSRFLIGFGSAFAFVGALKLATIWLPLERFAAMCGLISTLGMIGGITGVHLLTKLVVNYGWRITTYMSAWLGVILTIIILLIVRDKVKTKPARQSAYHCAYHPELSLKDLLIGLWQSLKNPYLWMTSIMGMFLFLALSALTELWGITYLAQTYGLTRATAGSVITMVYWGWAIGGPLAGWFSDFTKRRRMPLMFGSLLAAIIFCIILFAHSLSLPMLYILFFAFGILTSVEIIAFAIVREISSPSLAGTSIALINAFIMLGGVIFQPVIGLLLDWDWAGKMIHGVRFYSVHNYQIALSILPIGLIITFILSFFLRETHCHVQKPKD
jgi:sugar phosphate permease